MENGKKREKKGSEDEDLDSVIRSAVECFGTLGDRLRDGSARFCG